MLKAIRMSGLSLLLLLLLSACNPTATPRSLTSEQAASIVQVQLADVNQLPVTVSADGENALLVEYTGDVTGDLPTTEEGQQVLLQISRSIAGLIKVNYLTIDQVTVSPPAGSALQVSGADLSAWYNRNITEEEFLQRWTLPATAE
jgi:hypothetical protein